MLRFGKIFFLLPLFIVTRTIVEQTLIQTFDGKTSNSSIYQFNGYIAGVGTKPPLSQFGNFHLFSQIYTLGQSPCVGATVSIKNTNSFKVFKMAVYL